MKKLIGYPIGIILHPAEALKKLLKDKKRMLYGFLTLLFFSAC